MLLLEIHTHNSNESCQSTKSSGSIFLERITATSVGSIGFLEGLSYHYKKNHNAAKFCNANCVAEILCNGRSQTVVRCRIICNARAQTVVSLQIIALQIRSATYVHKQ